MFLGTKLCLPVLRETAQQSPNGSAIVNLASTAGIVGSTQDRFLDDQGRSDAVRQICGGGICP